MPPGWSSGDPGETAPIRGQGFRRVGLVLLLLLPPLLPGGAGAAEPLRTPFAPLPPATAPETGCPAPPEALRNIEGVSFYTDPAFSRPDPGRLAADAAVQKRLDVWQDAVQAAVARARAGEAGAAACALSLLDDWAKSGAMLGAVNQQGAYHRVWALAGAGLAFLRIRDAAGLEPVSVGRVGRWMREVADAIQPRYDRASRALISDVRNNHAAWAGLAVAVAGIASDSRAHFDWGMARLHAQLAQVTGEGALPQELARGALALHYHLFALEPVAALERLAAANGVTLPPEDEAALERLTGFVLAAAKDPSRTGALAGVPQSDPWLKGRPPLSEAAGLEIRAQARPDAALEAALAPFRPYRMRWLGGMVTGQWITGQGIAIPDGGSPALEGPARTPSPG